ncbi:hypothetical protein [Martelella soudanensis]|uniref:hypothetical protein n=1 Tax=unclassified Martelella TaxID=2629616 RepID=UPI0015DF4996|nr:MULTISPECIES: hypothetical protein [unclassified Martelella]
MNSSAGPSHYIAFRFHDIITALLILNYILVRRPDFLFTLGAVFIFFLVHGIINWLIVSFAFQLFHPSPGIKAYNFLIFFGMNEKYFGIHRSQGLFWEPGVFQIYLNVALHFFLFYKRQKFWAGLALVSVILTLSTTGIVIAGLQMAYAVIRGRGSPVNKALIILLSLPLLIVYVEFASTVVTDKISGDRAGSYWSRSFDTRNGLAIALDNPFGIGFDPSVYQAIAKQNIFNIQTNIVTDRGNTNGIVMLIYSTGWFWAFIFLTSTYLQKIFPEHRLLFFLVLFLSMSSSPLTFSPFFFLFTLSGFVKSGPLLRPPSR